MSYVWFVAFAIALAFWAWTDRSLQIVEEENLDLRLAASDDAAEIERLRKQVGIIPPHAHGPRAKWGPADEDPPIYAEFKARRQAFDAQAEEIRALPEAGGGS